LVDRQDRQTPAPRRRPRLDTLAKIRREIVALYHEARERRLDALDASRMGNLLAVAARLLEGQELERRIEALEQQAKRAKDDKS
jgi:hypothetical protein